MPDIMLTGSSVERRVSPGSLSAGTGLAAGGQREVDRALVLLGSVDFPPVLRETLLTAELVMTGANSVEDSSAGLTLTLALAAHQHALNILSLLSSQGFSSLKLYELLEEILCVKTSLKLRADRGHARSQVKFVKIFSMQPHTLFFIIFPPALH